MEKKQEVVYVCSRCGSTNVGRPRNSMAVELKCFDCGHVRNSSHKKWMDIVMSDKTDSGAEKREF